MGQLLLLVLGALVVGAVVFAVAVLITGDEPGLEPAVPDGRSVPFPATRPLIEGDVGALRFDTAIRGYRMGQVDAALRRAAYDIGYKEELIQVLEAEVTALRDGRSEEAETLRRAREAAVAGSASGAARDVNVDLGQVGGSAATATLVEERVARTADEDSDTAPAVSPATAADDEGEQGDGGTDSTGATVHR
jgi:DivIVA domain-containing protein